MNGLKALLVVKMLVLTSFFVLIGGSVEIGAQMTDTFGNEASQVVIDFDTGGGTDDSTELIIPQNSRVISATMNVTGVPLPQGGMDYPQDVTIDIGANGNKDWAWIEKGIGAFGKQSTFSDGAKIVKKDFASSETNLSTTIELPTNAKIKNATFDISGGNNQGFNDFKYTGNPFDWMGLQVEAVGDLNNDGHPDFAASAPHRWGSFSNAHVYVYYGNASLKDVPDVDIVYPLLEDDWFGYRVDGANDVNNDGFDDIIIGAYYEGNGNNYSRGSAFIYYGGDPMDGTADVQLKGAMQYDKFGYDVAGIGDVNNDSYADVLVGAPYNDSYGSSMGSAYVFFGGDPMDTVPDLEFYGGGDYFYLGTMVSSAGDMNNDGFADFMIGASGDDTNNNHDGAVYVFGGGPGVDNVSEMNIRPLGTKSFGEYGSDVGDLNNDGYDDIGICNDDNEVWIFQGSSDWNDVRDLRINGENWNDQFGNRLSGVPDLNRDGFDELIVGAWGWAKYSGQGKAYLYFGGTNMDAKDDFNWTEKEVSYEFGSGVAGIGDFNDDGFNDIAIGSDGSNVSGTRSGSVVLKTYFQGVKDPNVGIQDTLTGLWGHNGYWSGQNTTRELKDELQAAIDTVGTTMTDIYGNPFTELVLNISANGAGDILIKNLSIEYDLTVGIVDFADELNVFMTQNDPGSDGKYHIPIRVMSNSKGSVRMDGLQILINNAPKGTAAVDVTIPEGTINDTLVDLYDVFDDDYDSDSALTYSLKSYTNQTHMDVYLHEGHYIGVDLISNSTDVNWTGTSVLIVSAADKDILKSKDITFEITVVNVNDPPIITSSPSLAAMEDVPYTYQVKIIDGDLTDDITYSMISGPANMSIDPVTGLLGWTPSLPDVGKQDVSIMASDGAANVSQDFTIMVSLRITAENQLPVISSTPIEKATVGVAYEYDVVASDPDWDVLSYYLDVAPEGMTLDKNFGKVLWLPLDKDMGLHNITIKVSDGKDRIFQRFKLNVSSVNRNDLPKILGTPPAKAFVTLDYIFYFNSSDKDGDTLTFILLSGPVGMGLTGHGVLTWTPLAVGPQEFTIELTDGKGYITRTFKVDVSLNHAPEFISSPPRMIKVNEEYQYKIIVADPDPGNEVVIEIIERPYGMTFDNTTNELNWTPGKNQVGLNLVTIRASDGMETTTQGFEIEVQKRQIVDVGRDSLFGGSTFYMLAIVIILALLVGAFVMSRKRRAVEDTRESIIEDIFLIYKDGRLLSHHTRRLKPETDEYSLTAMLTAIQDFVRESIPTEGEEQKAIDEISFGDDKIILSHGIYVYIAAVTRGAASGVLKERMKETIEEIEDEFGEKLVNWNGDLDDIGGAKLKMKALIHEVMDDEPVKDEKAIEKYEIDAQDDDLEDLDKEEE